MRLAGQVAIVTGSSRGIGKAIALALAREGARVVVAARSDVEGKLPGTIHRTAEEVQALGGEALPLRCDVTEEEQVKGLVEKVGEAYGRVDILVNNAGIQVMAPLWDLAVRHWDLTMRVNLRGPFLMCKYVLPLMMEQRRGSIINITSGAAEAVRAGNVAYSVSKAALNAFTRGLAEEARPYNIAVNALDPGRVKTEGALFLRGADFDWRGWDPPEAVAPAVLWLALQTGETFTGRVVRRTEFGLTWP